MYYSILSPLLHDIAWKFEGSREEQVERLISHDYKHISCEEMNYKLILPAKYQEWMARLPNDIIFAREDNP